MRSAPCRRAPLPFGLAKHIPRAVSSGSPQADGTHDHARDCVALQGWALSSGRTAKARTRAPDLLFGVGCVITPAKKLRSTPPLQRSSGSSASTMNLVERSCRSSTVSPRQATITLRCAPTRYLSDLRSSRARPGEITMAPGDREWKVEAERKRDGIPIDRETAQFLGL